LFIDDPDDERFFYAFVGLTMFSGLAGLIWPTLILLDRIKNRPRR
jgi:hypothetical protein